jgi:hypothetical protein
MLFNVTSQHSGNQSRSARLLGPRGPGRRRPTGIGASRAVGVNEIASFGVAATAVDGGRALAEVGGAWNAPAAATCGWAYRKISYTSCRTEDTSGTRAGGGCMNPVEDG